MKLSSASSRQLLSVVLVALFVSPASTAPWKAIPSRKSCGQALVERVKQVCDSRGGVRSHVRVKRGIVNECCKNICQDEHIASYCSSREPQKSEAQDDMVGPLPQPEALINNGEQHTTDSAVSSTTTVELPIEIRLSNTERAKSILGDQYFVISKRTVDYEVGTIPPEYQHIIPPRAWTSE